METNRERKELYTGSNSSRLNLRRRHRYHSVLPALVPPSTSLTHHLSIQASLLKARSWISELQRQADPSIIVCLAGNKLDLAETQRQVPTAEAQKFADEEGLLFFEVSAKSAEGVEGMFQAIGAFRSRRKEELEADVGAQRTSFRWIFRRPRRGLEPRWRVGGVESIWQREVREGRVAPARRGAGCLCLVAPLLFSLTSFEAL